MSIYFEFESFICHFLGCTSYNKCAGCSLESPLPVSPSLPVSPPSSPLLPVSSPSSPSSPSPPSSPLPSPLSPSPKRARNNRARGRKARHPPLIPSKTRSYLRKFFGSPSKVQALRMRLERPVAPTQEQGIRGIRKPPLPPTHVMSMRIRTRRMK